MNRILLVFVATQVLLFSQTTRQTEGLRTNTPAVHALKNLTIIPSPGKKIEKGIIVIRNGVIEAVGANVRVPADAREWDCTGLSAYAGMIDLCSEYGQPKMKPAQPGAQPEQQRGANYWNANVRSEYSTAENFLPDKVSAEKLRSVGITSVVSVSSQGIFKGSSALVNVGDGDANEQLVRSDLFQHATLQQDRGADSYPNSLMGRIAVLRQTLIDAQWYANAQKIYEKNRNQPRPEVNASLASLENVVSGKQPLMMEVSDELQALRASAIAKEFNLKYILRGSGYEYRRIDAIQQLNVPVVLPVNFPDPPDVDSPEDAYEAGYEELRHWDFASENPARLKKAGITFAFTSHQLKDVSQFRSMIKTAIDCGLYADDALASVTTIPASLVGMEKQIGSLEPGKIANIILTDGELFAEKSKVRETWIEGVRYEVKAREGADLRGLWSLSMIAKTGKTDTLRLDIAGESESPSASVLRVNTKIKTSAVTRVDRIATFSFEGDSIGMKGIIQFSGSAEKNSMNGIVRFPDGSAGTWTALRLASFVPKPDSGISPVPLRSSNELLFPDGAFGRREIPPQQDLLIKNATIWTSGPQGNLEASDLLITKGKIARIGKDIPAPTGVLIIDAQGKHVTAGLIDAHSHTAITGGVNESGQAITAEVRIGDVINSDDINIYRQLAGGITVINQLHGSANAIGGQNSVIKLRWGLLPEQLKFEGAIPGIKFALGENPKQSNWGDNYTTRYPQTRMGVEQIIRDEFTAAKEYDAKMKEKPDPKMIPPRRDLELEAVAEILNGKRLVHSHCYRQDEILMLLRVSDDFGFTIGTLQHVLEGYKVADEIAKHHVGASLFSDWWAYKYEVIDAIPYAGKLMNDAGVIVSYNSDSNEMARRMNLEAAKAVKYGGVSEIDALKFVTINPAKQLRIDKRVGSLEVGKDGDVAIWSGHPLSPYSKCEQTWIEGRKFFDVKEDSVMRLDVAAKKAELVQKALRSKKKGSGQGKPMPQRSTEYSCHEEYQTDARESEVQ